MAVGTPYRTQGNLPSRTSGFVGREAELSRVRELLRRSRLVTVTGTGGVGKTRLALRAAAEAAAVPGFAVTPENLADVISVCRRLDGIPLSIELATVRLCALPLRQMADHIDDRLRLRADGAAAPVDVAVARALSDADTFNETGTFGDTGTFDGRA